MKLSHLTIIFLIIILPFSIISREQMKEYFLVLKDEVRLNNALDIATQDALDTLVDLNDEFQMMYMDRTLEVTRPLAMEAVRSFFQTMAINFNMPYIPEKTEAYFSMYVPAVVVIANDGFFIYSMDETASGAYAYQMSPKIPYTYVDKTTGAIINFSLNNYIKMYTNGAFYEGYLYDDYSEESIAKFQEYFDAFSLGVDETTARELLLESINDLTDDMSVIIWALYDYQSTGTQKLVPNFLIPGSSGDSKTIPLRKDYDRDDNSISDFQRIRRETIVNLVRETLQQEINSHSTYAKIMGNSYDFALPDINANDWTNSINDVSVMAFIQGMKIGTRSYYNNYALGASRIVQTNYIYGTGDKLYHTRWCSDVRIDETAENVNSNVVDIFVNREYAAQAGYYPCLKCNP